MLTYGVTATWGHFSQIPHPPPKSPSKTPWYTVSELEIEPPETTHPQPEATGT